MEVQSRCQCGLVDRYIFPSLFLLVYKSHGGTQPRLPCARLHFSPFLPFHALDSSWATQARADTEVGTWTRLCGPAFQ